MARPTPTAIHAIIDKVQDWALSDEEIVGDLNALTEPNPVEMTQVPRPMLALELIAQLSDESQTKLEATQLIVTINDAIGMGEREVVRNWVTYCKARGHVTETEADNVIALLDATIPDPSYEPLKAWSILVLGREVDLEDVAAARESRD